jgi:hypothetical protein
MARFVAHIPINMFDSLVDGGALGFTFVKYLVVDGAEIESEYHGPLGTSIVEERSVAGHPFTFSHHHLTGGLLGSKEAFRNGTLSYNLTGLVVNIVAEDAALKAHHFTAALNLLLAGPDVIKGSTGSDVLTGGSSHHNTFLYKTVPFGNDVITNFRTGDKIEFARSIFNSVTDVRTHSHVDASGHVEIDFNASNTITLDTVHSVSALVHHDFLFV